MLLDTLRDSLATIARRGIPFSYVVRKWFTPSLQLTTVHVLVHGLSSGVRVWVLIICLIVEYKKELLYHQDVHM